MAAPASTLSADAASAFPPDSHHLPPHDVMTLDYTRRDWARWDGFDVDAFSPAGVQRRSHAVGLDPAKAASTPEEAYFSLFKQGFLQNFYSESYKRFRWLKRGAELPGSNDDFAHRVRCDSDLPVNDVLTWVCYGVNEEYNHWRAALRARTLTEITRAAMVSTSASSSASLSVPALDAQVDLVVDSTPFPGRDLPQLQFLVHRLDSVVRTHLELQELNPHAEGYGLYKAKDGTRNRGLVYWKHPGILFLHGHVLHLLPSATIRAIRAAAVGSLSAQWLFLAAEGEGKEHHCTSQWLSRMTMFNHGAFVLLRSEGELRGRGEWIPSDEACSAGTATDRAKGIWPMAELVSYVSGLFSTFTTRFSRFGQTEFLSSYSGWVQDLLVEIVLHPASQSNLDGALACLARIDWDLYSNLLPQAGCFAGTSSRSYDLFAGAHNSQDRLDLPLYVQCALRTLEGPAAAVVGGNSQAAVAAAAECALVVAPQQQDHSHPVQVQGRTHSDGSCRNIVVDLPRLVAQCCSPADAPLAGSACAPCVPPLLPPSGNMDVNLRRNMLASLQLGGLVELPWKSLQATVLHAPVRLVEQRFSPVLGQERSNFIHPLFQVGHAGEDSYSTPTSVLACARLSGPATPGSRAGENVHGQTGTTSMVRLFPQVSIPCLDRGSLLCGPGDDPFSRGHEGRGVAGDGLLAYSRQVAVQQGGFMLVQHLLAPWKDMSDVQVNEGSWSSNLTLPLGVEGIYADDTRLPTAVGSCFRIPVGAVISIRHGAGTVAVRVVSHDRDADIPDSDRVESIAMSIPGRQAYALTWQVDESSARTGSGRVVLHHRHAFLAGAAPSPPRRTYRVAWLFGAGETRDHSEASALAQVVRQAVITEKLSATPEWNEADQPRNAYPAHMSPHSSCDVSERRWELSALIAGALKLTTARTDVYLPWQHAQQYKDPDSGPLHRAPYYFKDVVRSVNDVETLQWKDGEDPYRMTRVAPGELFEPHRVNGNKQVKQAAVTCHANSPL